MANKLKNIRMVTDTILCQTNSLMVTSAAIGQGRLVVLSPEEGGGYSVSCPALQGCHSQGETLEEALSNINEAIELYLEVYSGYSRGK